MSSQACIISPPSSWHAQPYWTKRDVGGISFWMIDIDVSIHVAKVEVRVVHRGLKIRTYNGSKNI